MIVLASLVGSMTLISSLLLLLEPSPVAPPPARALSSTDIGSDPAQVLFNTQPAPAADRWQRIVVHTRGPQARAENLEGYHFVIRRHEDDQVAIECSYRWTHQRAGAYETGAESDRYAPERAIGICLVGDFGNQPPSEPQRTELVWLVRQLQARFTIGPSRVHVESVGRSAGDTFPLAWFRRNLLTPSSD